MQTTLDLSIQILFFHLKQFKLLSQEEDFSFHLVLGELENTWIFRLFPVSHLLF